MRPKKRKTMGSNDLFRARLDQIIDQQSFQLSVKIDTPGVMGPGSRPGRQYRLPTVALVRRISVAVSGPSNARARYWARAAAGRAIRTR
jgi:hypothetical protein